MPRKSVAALATVSLIAEHRPAPPEHLSEEQRAEWEAITRRLPASWFPRETHGLLVAYVQHVTAHRVLSGMVDEFQPAWTIEAEGLQRYDKLLTMREREGRAMSSLATRLRITPQSRMLKDKAATEAAKHVLRDGRPPWEHYK
jgi:hypothetical protein